MQQDHKADHSLPNSAKMWTAWSFTFKPAVNLHVYLTVTVFLNLISGSTGFVERKLVCWLVL
jgi:hypothetical protein